MLLQYLVEDIEYSTKSDLNIEINKIEYDSKKIGKSDVFVAIKGYKEDGHDYISEAINNGASAVIIEDGYKEKIESPESVAVIIVENTRKVLAMIAAKYYDYPASKLRIIGIT